MRIPHLRDQCIRALLIGTTLGATGCKALDLSGLSDVFSSNLTAIGVTSGGVVEVSDTIQLDASGSVSGLIGIFSYAPVLDAQWSVSDPLIAKLITLPPPPEDSFPHARILVQGVRPGKATVSAQSHGIRGSADVRVISPIARIEIRTLRDSMYVGDTIPIAMTVIGSDGNAIPGLQLTLEVSGGVQLSFLSSGAQGVIATAAGPATVTARYRHSAGTLELAVLSR
ncbi:MAG TPA: hypothetical protein VGO33_01310 [Gemmatimonadaceae bacterium]|jgi:hypothetical protein|nr:hypothetical protein [Gemmatimonadaceae bacterium]